MMCVEATGEEQAFHDSLWRFDASVGVKSCCSAARQPRIKPYITPVALNASSFMCVNATGSERVFEDMLRRFDASVGVKSCCSAARQPRIKP